MRTITTLLLSLSILPAALSAQPVMTKNEYYDAGTMIQMVNCDASMSAGSAGSNVTWDFSGVTTAGGVFTTTVLTDTFTAFTASSNLMEFRPDGTVAFLQENNSDTYINGVYDTVSHLTTFYSLYDDSKRPFTYNSNYVDSYRVNIPSSGGFGTGLITAAGDAYGTLILPGGTYTNVLRIRKVRVEHDTVGSSDYITATTSYMWFDTSHRPPLLRLDSVSDATGTSQSLMYLVPSEGVTNVRGPQSLMTAYLDNSEHLFVNGFETGKGYQVLLYNIIGNKVFTETFTATGNSQRFEVGRQINPGIYLVRITMTEEPYSTSVIKIVKPE